jgi:hypothetical protein
MCYFSSHELENVLLHSVHKNGFSPVCLLMCTFRSLECKNDLKHSVHKKGFSPVCVLICTFKLKDVTNDLLHFVHIRCDFSCASADDLIARMIYYTVCTRRVSLQCAFSYAHSN